ncbi:MAG: hypothetical protein HRT66_06955 [Flavobacteriaceae bacterium]|nr:hypothetical protein [Flavobacteriaceae bacterium]
MDNKYDIYEPSEGHLERFEQKLVWHNKKKTNYKWMAIAACVVLFIGFGMGSLYQRNESMDLSDVSKKMETTEGYFVNIVNYNILEMDKLKTKDSKRFIKSVLEKIKLLELEFVGHKKALYFNPQNERIIIAMIDNYQKRIDLLKMSISKIKEIKEIKQVYEASI